MNKYNEQYFNDFKNDPLVNMLCETFGLNIDSVINELKNKVNYTKNNVEDNIKKFEDAGKTYYCLDHRSDDKKVYEKPEMKQQRFLMSEQQLENFIKNYRDLISSRKKLSYLYGIGFDNGSTVSFVSKINEIIWQLIKTIFGDENVEDIVAYVYGDSNFDSVHDLYEKLV